MYSCDQATTLQQHEPRTTARAGPTCSRGQADPAAVGGSAAAGVQQPPRRASKKRHGAARPPSRRSSTTVVDTDVANFRAMVQELTGFAPAAILRPLPRRVHAAVTNPFVVAAGHQGCGGDGRGQSSGTWTDTAGSLISADAPAVKPVTMVQSLQCAPPPSVLDGLSDIGSPEFDSWGDLSIEEYALAG